MALPAVIQTPEQFTEAIQNFQVAEVSPKLFGTLTDAYYGTLTQPIRKYSWTSGSSNLYQFLVLNKRYKNRLTESDVRFFSDDPNKPLSNVHVDAVVSEEAMNGIARVVGIPGSVKNWTNLDYYPATSVYSYSSQLVVYKEKDKDVLGTPKMPTWDNLIGIVNGLKPVVEVGPQIPDIPNKVIKNLKIAYSKTSRGESDPVQIFSDLTGIDYYSSRSFNTKYIKTVDGVQVVNDSIRISDTARSKIVKEFFTAVDLDNWNDADGAQVIDFADFGSGTKEYSKRFFNNFVMKYIDTSKDSTFGGEKFSNDVVLTIGVRMFLDQVYGASPYFTGFGIGYRTDKNPLVGKRNELRLDRGGFERFFNEEKLIEAFTGQEYFVNNLQWWSTQGAENKYYYGKEGQAQKVDVQVFGSKIKRDQDLLKPETTSDGLFTYINTELKHKNQPYNKFIRRMFGGIKDYDRRYVVTTDRVLFTTSEQASLTSDIIDATEIETFNTHSSYNPFHRDYILNSSGDNNEKLVDKNSMLYSVMGNDIFAFVSRSSGGIDRVYGSQFNDIITGSPAGTTSGGQMHVEAGDGNDVINTGRGASLVYTGDGKDSIFVEEDELFGDSILMDFDSQDKIYIPKSLKEQVSGLKTNTLTITSPDTNKDYDVKSFILSGESIDSWTTNNISYVQLPA